jgi:sigma-B regulation protein RsbU (phosphoserine phosphatase)
MKINSESTHSIGKKEIVSELAYLNAKVNALASLIEVSIIINSTLNLDNLIRLVMEKAQSVMKAEASSVMIIDEEKNVLLCPVALGEVGEKVQNIELKMDEGIAGWVATNGEPQIVPDVLKDPRFNPKVDEETGFHTRSILACPLKVKDKIIGVAEVINRTDGEAFNEEDLELFSTFCRQVAMAIENARIHHLELEKKKMEQQLEAAKFIQLSFMPKDYPVSAKKQFEVAAKSLPAISVGGDFYDFFEFNEDTIGFTVGDVSGKGIPAALFMARMISDFRLYTKLHHDPAKVLSVMNKDLFARSRRGMFVTSLYGVLMASTGEFIFANAGHLPFIRVPEKGQELELLNSGKGIPLGIKPQFMVDQEIMRLDKGDMIVSITDGVIEAKNAAGEAYSLERVMEVVAKSKPNVEEVVESLYNEIQSFSKAVIQHDDLTIVAIKWRGNS